MRWSIRAAHVAGIDLKVNCTFSPLLRTACIIPFDSAMVCIAIAQAIPASASGSRSG